MAAKEELEVLVTPSVGYSSFDQMTQRQAVQAETQMQVQARSLASSLQDEAKHAAEIRDRVEQLRTMHRVVVQPALHRRSLPEC